MPLKIKKWKGNTLSQYRRPHKPLGLNVAVCTRYVLLSTVSVLNSNHASPGNFISAYSNKRNFVLSATSTRQKSRLSPACRDDTCVLPLRRPTPPNALSRKPLAFQSRLP